MNTNLLAEGLNGNLAEIVANLQSLIDSFWVYIVIALAAVVVVWGAYIGIKIAIAHRNEEKINARDMIKNLIIGIVMAIRSIPVPAAVYSITAVRRSRSVMRMSRKRWRRPAKKAVIRNTPVRGAEALIRTVGRRRWGIIM